MGPVKDLACILLKEVGLGPITLYLEILAIKDLACWMLSRPVAIRRYQDVSGPLLMEHIEHLLRRPALRRKKIDASGRVKPAAKSTIMRKVRALVRLYDYRDRLEDGLKTLPPDLLTNQLYRSYKGEIALDGKTLPIPDEEHRTLLGAAVDFIRDRTPGIIKRFKAFMKEEQVIQINEILSQEALDETDRKELEKVKRSIERVLSYTDGEYPAGMRAGTQPWVSRLADNANVSFRLCVVCLKENTRLRHMLRRRRYDAGSSVNWEESDLWKDLRLLQVSCFIVIATSTGMRLGELLAIKIKGYEGLLYWIRSTLIKTSPNVAGEPAFWLCGELAAQAVRVLEQLHKLIPTSLKTRTKGDPTWLGDSIFRSYGWNGLTLEARPTPKSALYMRMKFFIKTLELSVGHVHPHQFRKTFARNVVRWSRAPILALQRHFKHWSLLMTDYYIGIDDDLITLYLDELRGDSRERLRQILAGECGGPGGLISQKRLMKMADNEELPLNFQGKEWAGTMEEHLDEICEEGVVAYKCADFTTCIYVIGLAKCGEGGPKAHECHPTECPNSHILVEDVPFYLNNIRQNQSIYDRISEAEKAGPHGISLLKRIHNDITAIRPLVALYTEKLWQLQNHYEQLSESEKAGSYGVILKSRLDRDFAALSRLPVGEDV